METHVPHSLLLDIKLKSMSITIPHSCHSKKLTKKHTLPILLDRCPAYLECVEPCNFKTTYVPFNSAQKSLPQQIRFCNSQSKSSSYSNVVCQLDLKLSTKPFTSCKRECITVWENDIFSCDHFVWWSLDPLKTDARIILMLWSSFISAVLGLISKKSWWFFFSIFY